MLGVVVGLWRDSRFGRGAEAIQGLWKSQTGPEKPERTPCCHRFRAVALTLFRDFTYLFKLV